MNVTSSPSEAPEPSRGVLRLTLPPPPASRANDFAGQAAELIEINAARVDVQPGGVKNPFRALHRSRYRWQRMPSQLRRQLRQFAVRIGNGRQRHPALFANLHFVGRNRPVQSPGLMNRGELSGQLLQHAERLSFAQPPGRQPIAQGLPGFRYASHGVSFVTIDVRPGSFS